MRLECLCQRLGLKTFKHDKQLWLGLEKPVGRISGGRRPGQRNAPHRGFKRQQRRIQARAKRRCEALAPGCPPARQHRRRHPAQAPRGFNQAGGQRILLARKTRPLQQRRGSQQVHGHIHAQIVARRRKQSQ